MPPQLKLLIATVVWGATPTIGRVLSAHEAPFAVVFGRFLVASIFLLWFAYAGRQLVAVPRSLWLRLAILGTTGILLHNGLLFTALETTPAATASIILGLIAMQTLLLDWLFYRRTPDRVAGIGVVLGFVGVAVVVTEGDLTTLAAVDVGLGEVLVFFSGLSWAAYSVVSRDVLEELSPLTLTTLASCVGVVLLVPTLFATPVATRALFSDPQALWLMGFLGFVGTALGFLWYSEAVSRLGIVTTALFINLVPVFGVLSAALFLGEVVGPSVWIGGLLILLGLFLVNPPWPSRQRVPEPLTVSK